MTLAAWTSKTFRLIVSSFVSPVSNMVVLTLLRMASKTTSVTIERTKLIGPKVLVEQCAEIIEELKNGPDMLYDTLVRPRRFTFCLEPNLHRSLMNNPCFFIGHDYLKWQEVGIRAYLVWSAFRIQADLHRTSARLNDSYTDRTLASRAANQTSEWLAEHDQPEALVQYFETMSSKLLRK